MPASRRARVIQKSENEARLETDFAAEVPLPIESRTNAIQSVEGPFENG
jgi:hypothetical protein